LGLGLLLLLPALPTSAQPRGGVGESCRARSDCREGLRCLENVCRTPESGTCQEDADCGAGLVCRADRCAPLPQPAPARGGSAWSEFQLAGTHFFAGLGFAPAMTGFWNYGGPVEVEPAFHFALRFGVLFDRTELALELAPGSWIWDFGPQRSSFAMNVSLGGLLPVSGRAYWPLRFGLGLASGDLPLEDVYMQGRLDLIGLAFHYGHLLFEVNLPSTRFSTEFKHVGIWAWLFNLSITYVI
jgi:hypothetical protein